MRGRRKTVRISEAEWNIMKVLWKGYEQDNRGLTLGEIVEKLSDTTGWSNTTIRTLIIRLSEKGAVSIDKSTGIYKYTPLSSKEEAVQSETKAFLDRVFDGDAYGLIDTLVKDGTLTAEEKRDLVFRLR